MTPRPVFTGGFDCRTRRVLQKGVEDIGPILVERFTRAMREKLTTGDIPFRKAYLGSLIDRVEVDDGEVRIVGRRGVLEQAVLASRPSRAGVHSFVPKWRAKQDERANTYVLAVAI